VGLGLLAAGLLATVLLRGPGDVTLTASHGVRVTSTNPPTGGFAAELVPRTEAELLAGADIFAGQVSAVRGVKVTFADWDTVMSVLTVQATSVIRGGLQPGDAVTVLVHPAVGLACSVCQVSERLGVGSAVVLVAQPAAEGWAASLDGSDVFAYSDVADYYLPDPVRHVFLETASGVVFSPVGWPSLAAQGTPVDADTGLAADRAAVEAFLRGAVA
jgi:hypothetical protein